MEDKTNFEEKSVVEIEGEFYIDYYQRGYRWGKEEVERLLEDIYLNGEKNRTERRDNKYCLQPIVIKKEKERFELIDGQQRITTLYLIYKYMHKKNPEISGEPKFFISYNEARRQTSEFLKEMDLTKENDNIDLYFLSNAYKTIESWFSNEEKRRFITRFHDYLEADVKVLWYEVESSVDSISLFTRLNIGKIPLTSSELIKAMFLSKEANMQMDSEKQSEIALQWDTIERELQNDKFWFFLTNNCTSDYQTRIDLIIDLIARKTEKNTEAYYTFKKIKEDNMPLQDVWDEIKHTYLILKDWFENHELYHKIGYLITTDSLSLQEIYNISINKTKDEFKLILNDEIKKSISGCNYAEVDYNNGANDLKRLLILFNIETVRQNGEHTQWFPFDKFKAKNDEKSMWTLEHIHAQHSKGMNKKAWNEWLERHLEPLRSLSKNASLEDKDLIEEVEKWINNPKLNEDRFEKLRLKILERFTAKTKYHKDSLANLALLNFKDNAALNNSTFDVKRNIIIEKDKNGQYIPFCTRMVFLKYYTPSKDNQLHFWGQQDMEAYIKAINEKLKDYLDKEIKLETEEFENE